MSTYNATIELPVRVLAPMWARRLVTETLRAWDWDDDDERRDKAVLRTNELVANVVEHTQRLAPLACCCSWSTRTGGCGCQ